MRAGTGGDGLRGLGDSALRRQRRRRPRLWAGSPLERSETAAVQRLFEECREVFSIPGTVPPPAGVERIKSILDSITAADVDLTPNMSYFKRIDPNGTPEITYLHLHKCEAFSIGIFCLPSRGIIPLHNHPGMTVFSKLLFGAIHVKSYDWAAAPQGKTALDDVQLEESQRLAKVKADAILTAPCETSVLYPEDGGNMHRFTAQNACAVLDVLGPPYDDSSGRHCQFYSASSSSVGDSVSMTGGGRYACLQEREPPQDFHLVGSTYMGPRILDH